MKATVTPARRCRGAPVATSSLGVTEAEKQQFIAVTAYYLAEQRNFERGPEAQDWKAAELHVNGLLDPPN
jgi:hypothetical protein